MEGKLASVTAERPIYVPSSNKVPLLNLLSTLCVAANFPQPKRTVHHTSSSRLACQGRYLTHSLIISGRDKERKREKNKKKKKKEGRQGGLHAAPLTGKALALVLLQQQCCRGLQGHGQAVAGHIAAAVGALGGDGRTRAAQHQVVAGQHCHTAALLLAHQALALALLLV